MATINSRVTGHGPRVKGIRKVISGYIVGNPKATLFMPIYVGALDIKNRRLQVPISSRRKLRTFNPALHAREPGTRRRNGRMKARKGMY